MARIPRVIHILDYKIPVKLVSRTELREVAGMHKEDTRTIEGCWGDETPTIFILKDLPIKKQRSVLIHELQHALVDIADWVAAEVPR